MREEFEYKRSIYIDEWNDNEKEHTALATDIMNTCYEEDYEEEYKIDVDVVLNISLGREYGYTHHSVEAYVCKVHFYNADGSLVNEKPIYTLEIEEEPIYADELAYLTLDEALHRLYIKLDYMKQRAEYDRVNG